MSKSWIKSREIPLIIYAICAIVPILSLSIDFPALNVMSNTLIKWAAYMVNFSFFLGIYAILKSHFKHISKRTPGRWTLSIITIAMLFLMLGSGFVFKPAHTWLYDYLWLPINITVMSFVGFQSFTILYRGYKMRSWDAAVLTITFVATSFQYMPITESIWGGFSNISAWFVSVPNMAGQRGLLISIGIGLIALTIRSILGYEKSFIGGGE